MRTRNWVVRKSIFNTCTKVKPLFNCFVNRITRFGSHPRCPVTNNLHSATRVIGTTGITRIEQSFWLAPRIENFQHQQMIIEPRKGWFADENQRFCGRMPKGRPKYWVLLYSSDSISHSALRKEHINAIGKSYTIVSDMQCASSLFYMY